MGVHFILCVLPKLPSMGVIKIPIIPWWKGHYGSPRVLLLHCGDEEFGFCGQIPKIVVYPHPNWLLLDIF